MPATWRHHSQLVYGEVKPKTPEREWLVAVTVIEMWLDQGLTEAQIALRWNAGGASKCSSGVNKYGVKYDSCEYVRGVLALLN